MSRFGWWLMGLPTGWRVPSRLLLRYGPYRWGAWLVNREGGAARALLVDPEYEYVEDTAEGRWGERRDGAA